MLPTGTLLNPKVPQSYLRKIRLSYKTVKGSLLKELLVSQDAVLILSN